MERIKMYTRRFFKSLFVGPLNDADIDFLRKMLTKEEQVVFYGMSGLDQDHSLRVAYALGELVSKRSKVNIDKMYKAALLHDVGKAYVNKLSLIERVYAVLISNLIPPLAKFLAKKGALANSSRFNKVIYCYKNHAQIGAQMARELGAEEGIVYLIEHHCDRYDDNEPKELTILREADSMN